MVVENEGRNGGQSDRVKRTQRRREREAKGKLNAKHRQEDRQAARRSGKARKNPFGWNPRGRK